MGMFDTIDCKYPLPEATKEVQESGFQTKSFENLMENYTITEEGKIIRHKQRYEVVPEEERPYYGKPEWNKNGLYQIIGSLKSIPDGDEPVEPHGFVNIISVCEGEWFEYELKYTDGELSDIKRIYREFGDV